MERHEAHMRRALELAERGWGRVSPNPMVGALIVAPDGAVLGEGWHEGPGTRHAEAMALEMAADAARGATLVTTLEPCDRFGRTPPCTKAIISAGIGTVVVAATDPNLGDGEPGLADLRDAGISVFAGICESEARTLNEAFERHVTSGVPFVVLKSAASLDGRTSAADGSSQWITSPEARADAQRLRAWADAIVVGSRTVLEDDPMLTLRDERWADAEPPVRVVVDTAGRVAASGALFDDTAATLVATTDAAPTERLHEWADAGAEVVVCDRDAAGGVSLPALLAHLGKRDVQGALVEGGATLAWSFLRDGLVDKIVAYVAPKIIGGAAAQGMVMGGGFAPVEAALPLRFERIGPVGPDLKVEAYVHRDR